MSETAPAAPSNDRRTEEMLRVDHAGEHGAVAIYRGQRAVFSRLPHKARIRDLLEDMEAGEQHHLAEFDRLLTERRVRPTALGPLWHAAGWGLGAVTALMGERAAMACTSAVESVIEGHYAEQADELDARGEAPELSETFRRFREEEIGHHDTAINEGAEDAPGYRLMRRVIRAGCLAAIRVSEKV